MFFYTLKLTLTFATKIQHRSSPCRLFFVSIINFIINYSISSISVNPKIDPKKIRSKNTLLRLSAPATDMDSTRNSKEE